MLRHPRRHFTFALAAGAALMILAAPACKDDGNNSLVAVVNDYYATLQDCGILSEGRLPTVDAADINDVPQAYQSYYRCVYNCMNAASCTELNDSVCNGTDTLEMRCQTSCPRPTWKCANSESIPLDGRCDGETDCADGSDELGCTPDEVFTCGSGETVPEYYRCDGEPDCEDSSDEAGCPSFTCGSGETVPEDYHCDGEPDCEDGSDEVGCPAGNVFTCGSGETVPTDWVCDAEPDCEDGSDEAGCAQYTCPQ